MTLNASYSVQGGSGSNGGIPGDVKEDSAAFPVGTYFVTVAQGGSPGNGGGASSISSIVTAAGGDAGDGPAAMGAKGSVSISYSGSPQATGGTVDFSSGNTTHIFKSSGALTVSLPGP